MWLVGESDSYSLRKDVDPGVCCPGMTVCRGKTRGKVMVPASPAEGFPGLSFSRGGRKSDWES